MRAWSAAALAAITLGLSGGAAMAAEHSAGPPIDPGFNNDMDWDFVFTARPPGGGGLVNGIRALRAKHYYEAMQIFDDLTDRAPQSSKAWELLGVAYAGELKWNASRRAYQHAVRLDPEDLVAHAGLFLALQSLRDPAGQAEADWLRTRAQACAGACQDAAKLKALERAGVLTPG